MKAISLTSEEKDRFIKSHLKAFTKSFVENYSFWTMVIDNVNSRIFDGEKHYGYDDFCCFATETINKYLMEYNWEHLVTPVSKRKDIEKVIDEKLIDLETKALSYCVKSAITNKE